MPRLVEEAATFREWTGKALDSSVACSDVISEVQDRFFQLADAYEMRSDASEVFFTRGDSRAGDAEELFFQFQRADQLVAGAYLISATEESASERCYDTSFLPK